MATMPGQTLQDHLDNVSRRIRGDIAPSELSTRRNFDSKAMTSAITQSARAIRSADTAIKNMMLKRAVLQERFEAARSSGDKSAEASAKRQIEYLDDQKEAISNLQKMEQERNTLLLKRASLEKQLSDEKFTQTREAQNTVVSLREANDQLYKAQDSYDRQLRVVRKISEGVDDVKKAHEQVNKEMDEEQVKLEMMSKTLMGRLGSVMASQFGEGWDKIKDDVKSKLMLFTKVGVAVGFGAAAMRDLSKDSDEVVNTLYKMGGSLDRVQNRFGYYATSVLELNKVQTDLRIMAASMNMPVEAVEGLTESIIHSIRVLDDAGKISFEKVEEISRAALNFSRRTGVSVQESVAMMSVLVNKYGANSEKAVDNMNNVTGSIVAANDMLEDAGFGKSAIFIEDIANLMKEAADNSDTFSLSLTKLGSIASNQMMIAKKFGATYTEALAQAKTLTDFLVKRNPYANYRAGMELAKGLQNDRDLKPFIDKKDVDGLTKVMSDKYGLSSNEANQVAKAIIGKAGNWMEDVGRLMGGTKSGIKVVTGQLEQYAMQAAKTRLETGATDINALQMAAGTMGVDANEIKGMFNTWTEAAVERLRKGEATTGFISAEQFEDDPRYKKAQEDAKPDNTVKNSPWTPTRVREMLDAVFTSPLLRLTIAAFATATALGFSVKKLNMISLTLTEMLAAIRMRGGVGNSPLGSTNLPGSTGPNSKPSWKERYQTAKGQGYKATAKSALGGVKNFASANKGLFGGFGVTAAVMAVDYATSSARAAEMEEMYDQDGKAKNAHDERLQRVVDEAKTIQGIIDDRRATLSDSEKSYYESLLAAKVSERDAISKQNAAYENNVILLDENKKKIDEYAAKIKLAAGPATKRFYQEELQRLQSQTEALEATVADEAPGNKQVTSKQRGLEVADNLTSKFIGKSAIELGASALGKRVGGRSAVNAVGKLGLKAGSKYAAKSALRAIPILGTVLSAGATFGMTEGSTARKLFAAGGDLAGTALGQFVTGGLGGGIAGGLAGEYGGLSAYDNIFGSPDANKKRDSLVTPTVVPDIQLSPSQIHQASGNSASGMTPFRAPGNEVLAASVTPFGSKIRLEFDAMSWGRGADYGLGKNYSRQTAQS